MTKYIYPIRSAKELVENIAKKAADKRKPKVNQHINEEEGDEFMDMGYLFRIPFTFGIFRVRRLF